MKSAEFPMMKELQSAAREQMSFYNKMMERKEMNERIKELARLAKQYANDNEDPDERTSWNFLFETKFAELIVQDCISQIALMGISNWQNDDISWAVEGCIDNIKARFGVE